MSPWLPKATIAIEDRRFYQHGGVDYEGIARALWRDVAPGKVVEGGSTIAQQLVRNLYTGHERTFERKLKEACLAIKLSRAVVEGADPPRVPEHRLLRQPRLRRRGGVADVLLAARARADAARSRRCSPGCRRRRRSTTRSTTRRPRSRAATRCCTRCSTTGAITRKQYRGAVVERAWRSKPGRIYTRHPAAVLLHVRDRGARSASTARTPCARAGCASTRRSSRGSSGRRGRRSARRSTTATIRPRRSCRSSPAPARSAR